MNAHASKSKKVTFRERAQNLMKRVEKSAATLVAASNIFPKVEKVATDTLRMLNEIKRQKKDNAELMKRVAYTNECVSQTLCEVLLAIKQNEYLQAWYPENGKKVERVNPKTVEEMLGINEEQDVEF